MFKICVFAGTTEGRELVEFLAGQPVSVTVCVATEYGETLLPSAANISVSSRRLPPEEISEMLTREKFDLVVDATHPYAARITESIWEQCRKTCTEYLRLLRSPGSGSETGVFVRDAEEAVRYLSDVEGNILLTTGSKDLSTFSGIRDFSQRVYARVLPMESSLKACQDAGLAPSHILAMQGPFSREMNLAMLRMISAGWLVTKDGGNPGGFAEKAAAAEEAGAKLVVIGRPPQREGMELGQVIGELCRRFDLVCRPEVTVVGIGPGARDAMTGEVRAAIDRSDCLIGAARMLESVSRPGQATVTAVAPALIAQTIASHPEYRRFTVVMSGDVGFFSGTKKLLPLLADCDVRVLPGVSSLVYLCAKVDASYEDVVSVSLHGRQRDISQDVRRHRRVFVLVGGLDGMKNICARLTESGLGKVRMHIGQRLSYPEERITSGTAEELAEGTYDPLSVALIENDTPDAVVTPGLPDDWFQRGQGQDGVIPMTKSEVRAVCLAKLRLTPGAVCWDVGAGTGSVAIEMARLSGDGQVYAIERKADACALLEENIRAFSLTNVTTVSGTAPEACGQLPPPTHVFLGGTGGNLREILETILKKNPNARIVAAAISLESIGELTACMKSMDFDQQEAVCVTVSRSLKAGQYHLMTGQNPIYIFTMQRTGEKA